MKKLQLKKEMISVLGNDILKELKGGTNPTEVSCYCTTDPPSAWCSIHDCVSYNGCVSLYDDCQSENMPGNSWCIC